MARCTRCQDGKIRVQVVSIDAGARTEETVVLTCIHCDGTTEDQGKVFVEDLIHWCECGPLHTFGSYPGYGECGCGVDKEHVHCGTCGNISQLG
jgi:hypothetical protein